MRIARVDPPEKGGDFEKAISEVEKKLRHVREDFEREIAKPISSDVPVPCPPRVAIVPGLGPNVTVIKVRIKSSDLTKGRSGGLRVLLQRIGADTWRPIIIYAKGEREDVARSAAGACTSESPPTTRSCSAWSTTAGTWRRPSVPISPSLSLALHRQIPREGAP